MKRTSGTKEKKGPASESGGQKLEIFGRHPFFEKIPDPSIDIGQIDVPINWKHIEALYYASLEYDIPYCAQLKDEYIFLTVIGLVQDHDGTPPKLTEHGKYIVKLMKKDKAMP